MWVDTVLDVGSRVTPLGPVVLAAADVDDEVRALSDAIHRASLVGATAFVTHLADTEGLRQDLSIERAADACWALINSLLLHLLVPLRGWSLQEYGEWLVRVVSTTLLTPSREGRPARGTVRTRLDEQRERYEALVDDRLAGYLSYQRTERLVVITKTSIEPHFDDRGVADALVRRLLDDLRTEGARRVVPLCHYAAWWLERHEEYAPLIYAAALDDER
jgi:predicted GNAT family acetyltransferase